MPHASQAPRQMLTIEDAEGAYRLIPAPPREKGFDPNDYIRLAQETRELKYIFFYLHEKEWYFNDRIHGFLSREPGTFTSYRFMDLKLECRMEVLRRFQGYDPHRGASFLTYIHHFITDAMLRNRITEENYSFDSLYIAYMELSNGDHKAIIKDFHIVEPENILVLTDQGTAPQQAQRCVWAENHPLMQLLHKLDENQETLFRFSGSVTHLYTTEYGIGYWENVISNVHPGECIDYRGIQSADTDDDVQAVMYSKDGTIGEVCRDKDIDAVQDTLILEKWETADFSDTRLKDCIQLADVWLSAEGMLGDTVEDLLGDWSEQQEKHV